MVIQYQSRSPIEIIVVQSIRSNVSKRWFDLSFWGEVAWTKFDFSRVRWSRVLFKFRREDIVLLGQRVQAQRKTGDKSKDLSAQKSGFHSWRTWVAETQSGAFRSSRQLGNDRSIYSISLEGKRVAKSLLITSLKILITRALEGKEYWRELMYVLWTIIHCICFYCLNAILLSVKYRLILHSFKIYWFWGDSNQYIFVCSWTKLRKQMFVEFWWTLSHFSNKNKHKIVLRFLVNLVSLNT
jgi:hypothetical protein